MQLNVQQPYFQMKPLVILVYSLVSICFNRFFRARSFIICFIRLWFLIILVGLLLFLALRRLDPLLEIQNRLPNNLPISRGMLWWYCLKNLCTFPWAVMMELETKARGEF